MRPPDVVAVITRYPGVQVCWGRARRFVLDRDRHRCRICGRPATDVDHIWPRRLGGSDHPGNLQALCRRLDWAVGADDA
jgi:5-methylcytosine-specific restriction endonuclease McrA